MKRFVCMLLAALLFCLYAAALAETGGLAAGRFEHDWVNEKDQDDFVLAWQENGKWFVLAVRYGEDDEMFGVEFEKCLFDEAKNAIVCQGGTLSRGGFLADENEEDEADAGVEILATGFGAVLTVDESGLLRWTGSGDAWEERTYINDDAEDDGPFVGEWKCGDVEISIDLLDDGSYHVYVSLDVSEDEVLEWVYTCALEESGELVGTGDKYRYIYNEKTDAFGTTKPYENAGAVFILDGDTLIWNEEKENAGQGMAFVQYTDEEDDTNQPVVLIREEKDDQ